MESNEWVVIGLIVLVAGAVLSFVLFVLQPDLGMMHPH